MRWDYGSVYKEIREAKGLTQREICGNQMSRTALAKFENSQATPGFENMEYLLRQLDMSFAEFEYLCNYRQPSQRMAIVDDFQRLEVEKDLKSIDKLIERCKNYLNTYDDIPIANILNLCKLQKNLVGKNFINKKRVTHKLATQIWEQIEKRDNWYESDFRQISKILTYFPIEHLDKLTEKLLLSLQKYRNFRDTHYIQFAILANISTIYLYDNNISKCKEVITAALDLAKESKRYDKLAFCQIRLGICIQDDKLIQDGLTLLELTEEWTMLKGFKEEIKTYR